MICGLMSVILFDDLRITKNTMSALINMVSTLGVISWELPSLVDQNLTKHLGCKLALCLLYFASDQAPGMQASVVPVVLCSKGFS